MKMAVTKNLILSVAVGLFHEWIQWCSIHDTTSESSNVGY